MSIRTPRLGVAAATLLAAAASGSALAGPFLIKTAFDTPTWDRWNYAFNSEPGERDRASLFGATGEPDFDDRDGQMYIAYSTADPIPPGLGASQYEIVSARLTVQKENDAPVLFDPTPDSYTAFLPEDDDEYMPDSDPGQAMTLYGAGFRFGFNAFAWGEDGPYALGSPIGEEVRVCHALGFDGRGMPIDVSNNVRDRFDPTPWAVGMVDGLDPGDPIPLDAFVTFDLDVANPDVQAYLQESMNQGLLSVSLTSLAFVVQQGGDFPTFYTRENLLVEFEMAEAPMLELEVLIYDEPSPNPGDLDGDGVVGPLDLAILLASWGPCPPEGECVADINMDGTVDAADLAELLANWG